MTGRLRRDESVRQRRKSETSLQPSAGRQMSTVQRIRLLVGTPAIHGNGPIAVIQAPAMLQA